MTNDERIEISNKCAELYGEERYILVVDPADEANGVIYPIPLHLINDWSRLMLLALEHDVYPRAYGVGNDEFITVLGYGTEVVADHPSKAHAVQATIVKALIAKKESE